MCCAATTAAALLTHRDKHVGQLSARSDSQVVHVTAAPALVAVVVAGVVAGAGVGNGDNHGGLWVEAGTIAVKLGTITILEGHGLALDLLALSVDGAKQQQQPWQECQQECQQDVGSTRKFSTLCRSYASGTPPWSAAL